MTIQLQNNNLNYLIDPLFMIKDPQQINFIRKLSRRSGVTMFFII